MTCTNRLKNQLIFLSRKQMALHLAFFFSIMPQAISVALVMLFLLERCRNDQKMAGLTVRKDRKCTMEPMGSATLHNIFISRMTILRCLGGSRENIIRKRGMWPENGLNAQCEGFKCVLLAVRLHCSKIPA